MNLCSLFEEEMKICIFVDSSPSFEILALHDEISIRKTNFHEFRLEYKSLFDVGRAQQTADLMKK